MKEKIFYVLLALLIVCVPAGLMCAVYFHHIIGIIIMSVGVCGMPAAVFFADKFID